MTYLTINCNTLYLPIPRHYRMIPTHYLTIIINLSLPLNIRRFTLITNLSLLLNTRCHSFRTMPAKGNAVKLRGIWWYKPFSIEAAIMQPLHWVKGLTRYLVMGEDLRKTQ